MIDVMNKILRVKGGAIILPEQLRALWDNAEILLRNYGNKIVLEGPALHSRVDIVAWKRAAGILKNRSMPNPVAWQRKIRKEWERKLP